jgi:hypothetical protein
MKEEIEDYLISLGYIKAIHPIFKYDFKMVKKVGKYCDLVSAIEVFEDGSVQMMGLITGVDEELTYWNDSHNVYDSYTVNPTLQELKILEIGFVDTIISYFDNPKENHTVRKQ